MTHLRIALEWFLNPDHFPLLAARERLQAEGWDLDLVVNEPLHLAEQRELSLTSHGCFFATDGGVLMLRAALKQLVEGAPIRIASPVSNPTTDGLCLDILRGWMAGQGATLNSDQVMIKAAGFNHVDNLADGFDGAWLAFANVEGVSALVRGMDSQMITTAEAGIPNFSALELIGAADAPEDVREAIATLVATLDAVTPGLCADPAAARALWYRASGAAPDAEAVAIVDAFLPRFLVPVRRSADIWRPMRCYLRSRGGDVADERTFKAMFA